MLFGTTAVAGLLDLSTRCHGGPKPGYDAATDTLHLALCGPHSSANAEVVRLLVEAGVAITRAHVATFTAESMPGLGYQAVSALIEAAR